MVLPAILKSEANPPIWHRNAPFAAPGSTDQQTNRSTGPPRSRSTDQRTDQRANSSRRNAQLSTGPRTPEGKAVSSHNALTHGLTTNRTVLPGENPEDFQTLLAEFEQEFQPAAALQCSLVRQLADAEWRLRRIPDFEAALLTRRLDGVHSWVENHPEVGPQAAPKPQIRKKKK